MSRKIHRFMQVKLRGTRETAIARKASAGCVLVQFDRFDHPQSHGWFLYPRHHFERRHRGPDKAPAR